MATAPVGGGVVEGIKSASGGFLRVLPKTLF